MIPEKYRALVKDVAEWVGADMVCYINPETLELVYIPSNVLDEINWEEEEEEEVVDFDYYSDYKKDIKRIEAEWQHTITIGPPEPNRAFQFMERFVPTVTDPKLSQALNNALHRSKPFRNFNAIIHESAEREAWFSFRQKCLEEYVFDEIVELLEKK